MSFFVAIINLIWLSEVILWRIEMIKYEFKIKRIRDSFLIAAQ